MFLLAADDHGHAAHGHHASPPEAIDHVVDIVLLRTAGGTPILTMHMLTLALAAILTVWLMFYVSRRIETGPTSEGHRRYVPKGRLAQIVETMVVYLRDEMVVPILGPRDGRKYLPFLLTVYFFILVNNLLGLLPLLSIQHLIGGWGWGDWHFAVIGGTATGNIAVTAGLAVIAFIAIQYHGFRDLGVLGWMHHQLGGAPWWLAPIMVPVELIGLIVKPAALAIRLFANMLAGHMMMATLVLFGFMALRAGLNWLVAGVPISLVSMAFAVAISFLELFVAILQAFVFMFLTTVFISLMSHHAEELERGEDDEHLASTPELASRSAH